MWGSWVERLSTAEAMSLVTKTAPHFLMRSEIDQTQVHDELMRWYRSDIAPVVDVRPLPFEQPGQVYLYATEDDGADAANERVAALRALYRDGGRNTMARVGWS